MLELKKNENEDAVRTYCAASALAYSAHYGAYTATDGQGEAGYCVFALAQGALVLLAAHVREEDGAALADGLVRAVMAYALHSGVNAAKFAGSFDARLRDKLRAFGHINKTVQDIDKFLTSCKNCAR